MFFFKEELKMNAKKFLAMTVSMVMCAVMCAGCGSDSGSTGGDATTKAPEAAPADGGDGGSAPAASGDLIKVGIINNGRKVGGCSNGA